jgi:hypothetical protein
MSMYISPDKFPCDVHRQVGKYKVWGPYGKCDGIHFPMHTCMLKNNTGKLIVYEVRRTPSNHNNHDLGMQAFVLQD